MLDHPKWHDYCVLDYVDDTTGKEVLSSAHALTLGSALSGPDKPAAAPS